jgi:cobalt-zinc-cadmium efflux system protein
MHDHSGHAHDHRGGGDARRIAWALALTACFMVAEVVAGFLSGSLTLLADAGHMLTDAAALGMALAATRIGARPSDGRRSFGYHRLPVLAALVNGLMLFAIVGWIAFEAAQRFFAPHPILAGPMLVVACLGLLANIAAFMLLRSGNQDDLNMRGAAAHVLGDLLGSVAAIAAAVVILATGWTPIDPLLSVLVALLVLRSAYAIVRRAAHILLEGTPEGFDAGHIREAVQGAHPDVHDVHHVHVWSLTPERSLATLHVRVRGGASPAPVLRAVTRILGERFGLHHAPVQIETVNCPEGADCAEPGGTPLRPA